MRNTIGLVGGGEGKAPATFGEEIEVVLVRRILRQSSSAIDAIDAEASAMLRCERQIPPADHGLSQAAIHSVQQVYQEQFNKSIGKPKRTISGRHRTNV